MLNEVISLQHSKYPNENSRFYNPIVLDDLLQTNPTTLISATKPVTREVMTKAKLIFSNPSTVHMIECCDWRI